MNPNILYLKDLISNLHKYPYVISNIVVYIYDNKEDNELIKYFKNYHIKIAYKVYLYYYSNKRCDSCMYIYFFKIIFNKNLFDRLIYEKRIFEYSKYGSGLEMILYYEKNNI